MAKYEEKLRAVRHFAQKLPEKIFDNLVEKYYNAHCRCENNGRTHIARCAKSQKIRPVSGSFFGRSILKGAIR